MVNQIYYKAKEEKNNPQLIKALIQKINYLQEVEEESLVKIQKTLHDELKTSHYPVKPLLHSMIAEQYWKYYRSNRYKFIKRTATKQFVQNDMRTWDMRKLVEVVFQHYKNSLVDVDELKKTKIDIYDNVLYVRKNGRKYRPTLYDFLAHRAVDFYMNRG